MKTKHTWNHLLFLLPSLAGVMIFYIFPFEDVICRSFMDDMGKSFIGTLNYAKILHSSSFRLAGRNTLVFILCSTPVLLVLSLGIALLLHQKTADSRRAGTDNSSGHKFTLVCLLPLAIPAAALTGVWNILFHEYGMLNTLFHCFGIAKTDWLNSKASMLVIIATYLWRNFGYTMILWLAGLSAISPQLYEAASVEGADFKKQFCYITLPLLKPLGFTVSVLAVLNSFKAFRDIYLISGDYPNKSVYMIQHILNNWFTNMEFGKITAAALVIVFFAGWLVFGLQIGFSWQKRRNYYE